MKGEKIKKKQLCEVLILVMLVTENILSVARHSVTIEPSWMWLWWSAMERLQKCTAVKLNVLHQHDPG